MAVHMIWIGTAPPNNNNHFQRVRQACEDWAASYDETLETKRLNVEHFVPDQYDERPEHMRGYWRFSWAEDATQLLDDIHARLQTEVSWAVIKYHECDHDQTAEEWDGCSWDEARTQQFGTVPGGLA